MKLTGISSANDISIILSEKEAFVVHWALSNYVGLIEYSLAYNVAAHAWPDDEPLVPLNPTIIKRMVSHHAICQDIAAVLERLVY
ncbi:MAG: hypothetical protein AAB066_00435 [Candidatus Margulisiibacteriota bacterium]|jgi:hypothetical protein